MSGVYTLLDQCFLSVPTSNQKNGFFIFADGIEKGHWPEPNLALYFEVSKIVSQFCKVYENLQENLNVDFTSISSVKL